MGKVYVVGVAGGFASGKTTIVEQVRQYFGDQIEVIGHDSYYLPHNNMTYEERTQLTMTILTPLIRSGSMRTY